jgi:uncharacterized protein involved in outer membrane biogenesis
MVYRERGQEGGIVKRAAVLGLSVLLLLLAAAVVLPSFLDWNRYREEVAGALQEATGRRIGVGALTFRLLPQPTLRAAGVTIANIAGGKAPYFADIKALDVRVALFPLLTGNVSIDSIALVSPHIVLETLPDGRHNWRFQGIDGGDAASRIHIDDLKAEDGTVTIRHADGSAVELTGVSAALSAASLNGPVKGMAQGRYKGEALSFDFSVGNPATSGGETALDLDLKLAGTDAALSFLGGYRAAGDALNGSLSLTGKDLSAAAASLARMTGQTLPALPQTGFALSATVGGRMEALTLDDMTLAVNGEALTGSGALDLGKAPSVTLDLAASRFSLDRILEHMPPASESRPPAAFTLPGLAATVKLNVTALDYRGSVIRQLRLDGTMKEGILTLQRATALLPGTTDVALSGSLKAADGKPDFEGDIKTNTANLRSVLTWAGADLKKVPEGRLVQGSYQSHVLWRGGKLSLDNIGAALDSMAATGKLEATFGERPAVTADLAFDRLTLDGYLPRGEGDAAALPFLADFDADLTLKADRLAYGRTIITGVAGHLLLKDATLRLDRVSAEQWGGARVAASGSLSGLASQVTADLKLSASGDYAERFFTVLGVIGPEDSRLFGPFSLDATLKGDDTKAAATLVGTVGGTSLHLNGTLSRFLGSDPAVAGDFKLKGQSLSELADQAGFSLHAEAARTMPTEVTGHIDGSKAQGELTATLGLGSGTVEIASHYADKETRLTVKGHQDDPVPLLRALGLSYQPAGPVPATDFEATVTRQPKTTRIADLKIMAGDMEVEGTALLDETGARPKLTANLDAASLTLDPLLPATTGGVKALAAAKGQTPAMKARARWSHRLFDWSLAQKYDADIHLSAQTLRYGPYAVSGAVLDLAAKDGIVTVDPLSGGLFGGTVTLKVTANATAVPAVEVSLDLANVQAADLAQATIGASPATGRLTAKGDFQATGRSQAEMIAALAGEADLSIRRGAFDGLDLGGIDRSVETATGMDAFRAALKKALASGRTPFATLSSHISVKGGVAEAGKVETEMADAKADLHATLDLNAWTVDAGGRFRLAEAGAPPLDVTLSGAIDEPSRRSDSTALANFVERRLGAAVLQKAIGGQEKGLNDLLGRGTAPATQ